jgi:hypothetical protein
VRSHATANDFSDRHANIPRRRVEVTGAPMKAMAFGLLGIRVYQDRCGCFDEFRAVLRSSLEGCDRSPLRHCIGGAGH